MNLPETMQIYGHFVWILEPYVFTICLKLLNLNEQTLQKSGKCNQHLYHLLIYSLKIVNFGLFSNDDRILMKQNLILIMNV